MATLLSLLVEYNSPTLLAAEMATSASQKSLTFAFGRKRVESWKATRYEGILNHTALDKNAGTGNSVAIVKFASYLE